MPKLNALEMLKRDHREMQSLFQRLERASEKEQDRISREVISALKTHAQLEEDLFYPYVRESSGRDDVMEEASVEHEVARTLLEEVESGQGDAVHQQAVLHVLADYLSHHIREEEEKIFPMVAKMGVDLEALGLELMERREALQGTGRRASRKQSRARPPARRDTAAEDRSFMEQHGKELSPSTRRAKWIHSPDEHADRPGQTLATRNPDVIRQWADARKAHPATTPGADPQNPRVLRLDFPDYDRSLQRLDWQAWFRTFEERGLVFLFQEKLKAGKPSNFFRLDHPEREDA